MNILLVEDETHTANLLKEIIEQKEEYKVIKTFETVVDTVFYLSNCQNEIDLCFFDIQLADGDSFEIFRHVDLRVPVVFCTAFDKYAMQAIKNNGIDYVLKPFKEDEIHSALEKYEKMVKKYSGSVNNTINLGKEGNKQFQQRFLTQFRQKTKVINIDEVALFHIKNETVYIITTKGEKFPIYKKMDYIESNCDPAIFFRINRQMLLNRYSVESLEPTQYRKIRIHLNFHYEEEIIVSRLKVSSFKKWLK